MDNVRELTALLVAKNKLLEKIRNGDYDLEKSDIKEHISKCKEILPEDLSDKLSSTVDNLVDLYETMFEATDLDEADVEKASKLHEELGKLHEDVIYDIYASDLKLAYLSGELNEKDINDLKSNDYLTDDEKSIITKTIKELEDVREVENNNMENAEQQSMKDNEKGNENKAASLTDFYNDLKLFNTFFQQFKNNLSNGTFTLDELNLNVKEFETFEEFYDSKLKNWNIPINQMTNDMMSMFNNISKTRSDISDIVISEREKLSEQEKLSENTAQNDTPVSDAEESKDEADNSQTQEQEEQKQQAPTQQEPTLASMLSSISFDSDTPVKIQVEKMIIEHDLQNANNKIQELVALKAKKESNGKHLSIKEAIELHKLTTTKVGLEKMLSDVSNLGILQELRESRIAKYTDKINEQEKNREGIVNEVNNQESQLGKWISNKKLGKLNEKIARLKNRRLAALDQQKSAVTLSYELRLKLINAAATFNAYKDFAANVLDETKKMGRDAKGVFQSSKSSLSKRLEELKNKPIFMKRKPSVVNLPQDNLDKAHQL